MDLREKNEIHFFILFVGQIYKMPNKTEIDDIATYLAKLTTFNEQNPIMERGDVATLKRNFDGDWEKFIRTTYSCITFKASQLL